MRLSYTRQSRFTQKKDFSHLREKGQKFSFGQIFAYTADSRLSVENSRLAMSVGVKVGNAVRRNRLKRIIREEFRLNSFQRTKGKDLLVVIPHKNVEEKKLRPMVKGLFGNIFKE